MGLDPVSLVSLQEGDQDTDDARETDHVRTRGQLSACRGEAPGETDPATTSLSGFQLPELGEIHAYRFSCPVQQHFAVVVQPARMDAIPQVCDWAHTYTELTGDRDPAYLPK